MTFLLNLHSGVRWLVVFVAVVAIVVFALNWARGTDGGRAGRRLMMAFLGLFDTQVLLGISLLLWAGLAGQGFPLYRIEHGVTMIIAMVVGHLSARWRSAPGPIRARNYLFIILVVMLLVVAGVNRLPQGWFG